MQAMWGLPVPELSPTGAGADAHPACWENTLLQEAQVISAETCISLQLLWVQWLKGSHLTKLPTVSSNNFLVMAAIC